MKKVLIAAELLAAVRQQTSFLNRADVQVFTAGSTDEVLELHRKNLADLIILPLDLPGTAMDRMCGVIRQNPLMGGVQILMVCPNNREAMEQASRCRPNAVLPRPVSPAMLLSRAQQMLDVASRETYRVLINVSVSSADGNNSAFFCRSGDISATGMLIETDRAITHGSQLQCSFFLPNSVRIQAKAEIVRTVSTAAKDGVNRYGVRFTQIDATERKALEDFIGQKTATR